MDAEAKEESTSARAAWPLAAAAGVVLVIGVATTFGFQQEHAGTASFWVIVGAPTVLLAAIGAWRARAEGELGAWLRPTWGDFTRAFIATVALFAAAWLARKVVVAAGGEVWLVRLYMQLGETRELQARAPLVGLGVLVMAAAEEIVWRGFVPRLLEPRLGSRVAWIVAVVLYALAHVPTAWALRSPTGAWNPVVPLAALGCGLVWGGMTRAFGRLTPSILAHALFDWCVLMMFPLA